MAHSCVTVPLDAVFARSTPGARAAFDAFVALIERCGPVEVIGQKTRIVIMARVRLNVALTRQLDAPWVERIETYLGGRWNAHRFIVRSPADVDAIAELPALVCEGYRDLGMQEALRRQEAAATSRPAGRTG